VQQATEGLVGEGEVYERYAAERSLHAVKIAELKGKIISFKKVAFRIDGEWHCFPEFCK
jgi:hypothetical protein